MDRPALMAIVLALLVVLLALMVLGWSARRKRQAAVAAPSAVPESVGELVFTGTGRYVATTVAGDPLDRIAVRGLGFRGGVTLTVTTLGMIVALVGRDEFWIPAAEIRDQRRATWTIDRVVETDGLQLIQWNLGGQIVESYFRFDSPTALEHAVEQLIDREEAAS